MSSSKAAQKLSENEIRPDDIMEKQKDAMMADIEYILKRKSGFVKVKCPACNADRGRLAFQKYTLDYQRCGDCRTIYINPRPTEDQLADFYRNSQNYEYWNKYIFPATEDARREKIFKPRAERVREICKKQKMKPKTLVEVGAGFGTFCEEVQKLGFVEKVIAVEPTPGLAQTCRAKGLNVIESPVEKAEFAPGSVDLVCSFEVLEHLFDPADFIEKCAKIMRPGGLAVITNPNGEGFDVVVSPEHSGTVDVEHLNYFNPDSMRVLFERFGFEVLEVTTPGKLDAELVRKMFLSEQLKREDDPFLYQVLVERWDDLADDFQEFVAGHNLSSHMWTIARKR